MFLRYNINIPLGSILSSLLPRVFLLSCFTDSLFPLFQTQMPQLVSVYVSVTSRSPPSPPPPFQTLDWYGSTRLRVFLALPQMGPWQRVRDQNVLYLSCQALPHDQNGSRPLGWRGTHPFLPLFEGKF